MCSKQHCRRLKHGFAPVAGSDARVLILGSMPGDVSLQQQQYYAHPRNAFWKIMARLLGFDVEADYHARTQALLQHRIALWDVLQACERRGSLDSAIVGSSIVSNDFGGFFAQHPAIDRVFFNGRKAETEFRRRVMPTLQYELRCQRLPSTSPAMAGMTFEQKLEAWRVVVQTTVQ